MGALNAIVFCVDTPLGWTSCRNTHTTHSAIAGPPSPHVSCAPQYQPQMCCQEFHILNDSATDNFFSLATTHRTTFACLAKSQFFRLLAKTRVSKQTNMHPTTPPVSLHQQSCHRVGFPSPFFFRTQSLPVFSLPCGYPHTMALRFPPCPY